MNNLLKIKQKTIKLRGLPADRNGTGKPLSMDFKEALRPYKAFVLEEYKSSKLKKYRSYHHPFTNLDIKEPSVKDLVFYRHQKLDLPRDKFATLKDKLNWKITRDKSKADYQVISNKLLESTLEYSYHHNFYTRSAYIKLISILKDANIIDTSTYDVLNSFLEDDPYLTYRLEAYLYLRSDEWSPDVIQRFNSFQGKLDDKKSDSCSFDEGVEYDKNSIKKIKDETAFDEFSNSSIQYVYDTHLVKMSNADSAILSNDDFDMIENLVKSNNVDDINIGLNVLANCNLEKSLGIVSYFYVFYFNFLKDSSIWNSINVKSLRTALTDIDNVAGRFNGRSSYAYDCLINFLMKNNSLTMFTFKKISSRILNQYTNQFFQDKTVFKIPEIELKDDWKDHIKENSLIKEPVMQVEKSDLPF